MATTRSETAGLFGLKRSEGLILLLVLMSALTLRLALALPGAETRLGHDAGLYERLALNLSQGRPFAAYHGPRLFYAVCPPAFPAFLAVIHAFFGRAAAPLMIGNVLLSLAWVAGVFFLARDILGRGAGWVALFIAAFYFESVEASAILISETMFMAALVWMILFIRRAAARSVPFVSFTAGVLSGAAILTKGNALTVFALAFVWFLLFVRSRRWCNALVLLLGALLIVLPWSTRNAVVVGTISPSGSIAPFNLWMGNHEGAAGKYIPEHTFEAFIQEPRADETAAASTLLKEAVRFSVRHPRAFLERTWQRTKITLGTRFWELGRGLRAETANGSSSVPLITFDGLVFLGLLGLVVMIVLRRGRDLLLLGACLAGGLLPVIIMLGEYRFRIPFDFVLILLASAGTAWLLSRRWSRFALKEDASGDGRIEARLVLALLLLFVLSGLLASTGIFDRGWQNFWIEARPQEMDVNTAALYDRIWQEKSLGEMSVSRDVYLEGEVSCVNTSGRFVEARLDDYADQPYASAGNGAVIVILEGEKWRALSSGDYLAVRGASLGLNNIGVPMIFVAETEERSWNF